MGFLAHQYKVLYSAYKQVLFIVVALYNMHGDSRQEKRGIRDNEPTCPISQNHA